MIGVIPGLLVRLLLPCHLALVTRVIDADTLDLIIPLRPQVKRLRLSAVNAPELKTSAGRRARRVTQMLLLLRVVLVKLETTRKGKLKQEKYHRYLGSVYCPLDLGKMLLLLGVARPYR
ncbi:MAG: hypothetical protein HC825_06800 [Oscillatoriales cyanobacterium RM1_1_9]|nr:hypothetical protein [Oscillatoriales cyanobacterium SM2_3_0]NJO71468.1 hypothetical protein [Oscillatoriales cyanobacterium RM1_1_9]